MRTAPLLVPSALILLVACDPGLEVCGDGIDNDHDTLVDCLDDDCSSEATCGGTLDGDGDGLSADEGDCDDGDASINPYAAEVCDGVDNDCDDEIDEGAVDVSTWYADVDGDGYGDADSTTSACEAPSGHVANDEDCDDRDASIHPDAEELCDGVDNDCDSLVDDIDPGVADASTWYMDYDGDSYGHTSVYDTTACEQPSGYVGNGDDCDDSDLDIHPDAVESCDEVDQDCDGTVDDETECYDDDGDGQTENGGDCDDGDPGVYSGVVASHEGIAMAYICPGTFTMGSPDDEVGRYDQETQHEVELSRGLYLGVYEVTQAEFYAFTGETPSYYDSSTLLPVEQVSWHDAAAFANAVSDAAGFAEDEWCYECVDGVCTLSAIWSEFDDGIYECPAYRMPTEAEWEYAARAGASSAFSNGGSMNSGYTANCDGSLELDNGAYLDAIAVYCGNDPGQTEEVGGKDANPWGLYDVHGNVLEWCHDWYEAYDGDDEKPWGSVDGSYRVLRGGAWNMYSNFLRSASRNSDYPTYSYVTIGFRLAKSE